MLSVCVYAVQSLWLSCFNVSAEIVLLVSSGLESDKDKNTKITPMLATFKKVFFVL